MSTHWNLYADPLMTQLQGDLQRPEALALMTMTRAEQALWSVLDEAQFPFRSTRQDLVARFGQRPSGWSAGLSYCEVELASPLLSGLAHPFVFQFSADDDLDVHATTFFGYLRGSDDADENFRSAVSQLAEYFGDGQDVSVSNTRCQEWRFGRASVTARIFPPELNQRLGRNARHEAIPGSKTECGVTLETAWRRALSQHERTWLAGYDAVHGADEPPRRFPFHAGLTRDWPDDLPPPAAGFGLSADSRALLHVADGSVNVLPAEWIERVEYSVVLPAKGGGGDYLSLRFRQSGRAEPRRSSLTVAECFGKPHAFDELAAKLAERLGVPLSVDESHDC